MRLTIPGQEGYHPQVGGNDLVRDGGKVDDSSDVTNWLLTRLGQIHDRSRQIISDHLANRVRCWQLVAWLLPRLYADSSHFTYLTNQNHMSEESDPTGSLLRALQAILAKAQTIIQTHLAQLGGGC